MTHKFFAKIISGKKLVLFGAGGLATELLDTHLSWYEITYICDNDVSRWNTKLKGIPVYSPSKILEDKENIVVFIASAATNEILPWLIENGINYVTKSIFYTPIYEGYDIIVNSSKEYLMDRCAKRKLLIYGTGPSSEKLSNQLSKSNLQVEYYIDDAPNYPKFRDKKVLSYNDIVYEHPDSFFIIAANDEKESYGVSRQKFMQLGLTEHIDFTYYSIIPVRTQISAPFEIVEYEYDAMLGYNRLKETIEGFEVFGDSDPEALKIITLGGSTTESIHSYIKGWAPNLADMLIKNGFPATIYCGGICGYTSSQELLKLIRDALPLGPDIILSYSGWNDFRADIIDHMRESRTRPFVSSFQVEFLNKCLENYPLEARTVYYGLENDKDMSEIWLDNTRTMKAIANEFNILFLSFLQPSICTGSYEITESQKIILSRRLHELDQKYCGVVHRSIGKAQNELFMQRYNKAIEAIKSFDYIHDLTNIFSGHTNIFTDMLHVTESGNKIIAENIYQILLKYLDGGRVKC